ncbi:MAG: response regulator transcription factor [Lachnospiraceae bacterium]|nr:response regulator transcription factor [Lachnospiraceae bacterium]
MAYRVIIVEDYKMVRQVFSDAVEQAGNYELAGAFQTAEEAVAYVREQNVDLILMDVLIPGGMSGLEAAEKLKQTRPDPTISIVTSMPELSYINRAREIGVDSFWYKEVQEQPILEIMDRTMAGESVYPGSTLTVMLGDAVSTDFTEREVEILRELVGGASNKEIGDKLSITESTVKMHITNILQKTGFRSRLELAVRARHIGVAIKE